jgi:hypothetical protein
VILQALVPYVPKETPPSILPAGEGNLEAARNDAGAVTRSSEELAFA